MQWAAARNNNNSSSSSHNSSRGLLRGECLPAMLCLGCGCKHRAGNDASSCARCQTKLGAQCFKGPSRAGACCSGCICSLLPPCFASLEQHVLQHLSGHRLTPVCPPPKPTAPCFLLTHSHACPHLFADPCLHRQPDPQAQAAMWQQAFFKLAAAAGVPADPQQVQAPDAVIQQAQEARVRDPWVQVSTLRAGRDLGTRLCDDQSSLMTTLQRCRPGNGCAAVSLWCGAWVWRCGARDAALGHFGPCSICAATAAASTTAAAAVSAGPGA
jgi:hypothetical protein